MSNQAFVYLYLNIGSEMVYIVQNRLKAQNICKIRSSKVLDDILLEFFNEKFLEETFHCDRLPNHLSLKQLLTKLVHCSIMKLNESSMDKLFDLIIMVFKYQLAACTHSTDLIQITLNHLHSLTEITDKQPIKLLIALARNKFILNGLASSHAFKIQFTRQTLLNYLIGMKIRVSVLLRIGAQCEDGRFRQPNTPGRVACHCQLPGKITNFDNKGQVIYIDNFSTKGHYEFDPSLTTLGFNIYEREEELGEKFKNESNETANEEIDENNNKIESDHHHQNKLQFTKEAQLLAVILGRESQDKLKLENESEDNSKENGDIIKSKKDFSRFWLSIDLELDKLDGDLEKEIDKSFEVAETNDNPKQEDNLNKLESQQEFGLQKLDNKDNHNLSEVNLMKIKQQMMDIQSDSNRNEPNLLELLDAEC